MRITATLIGIAALVVASTAAAGQRLSGQEIAWIERNKDHVRARLKDGDAAKFRNIRISYKLNGTTPIVCGEVNSRNSFGAYVGFQGWIGAGSVGQYLAADMAPGEFPKLWRQFCG